MSDALHLLFKKHTVYVPTSAKLATGAYTEIEPVAVVAVTDTEGLRQAFLDAMARGNSIVPNPQKGSKWPPPVVLKYARAASWSAFMHGAAMWSIKDYGGAYQIVGHHVHTRGNATEDPSQKITLPPESNANDVADRMIKILQNAASK